MNFELEEIVNTETVVSHRIDIPPDAPPPPAEPLPELQTELAREILQILEQQQPTPPAA
jgi:hypothetical protein